MHRTFAIAVVALVSLVGAACGGGGGASARQVVADAPAATLEASTARTSTRMTMSGIAGTTTPIDITADGAVDFETGAAELSMDMGEALRGTGMDGSMVVRTIGDVVYLQSPLFANGVPGVTADSWLRIDLGETTQAQGLGLDQLRQLGDNDPRQGLAVLRGVTDGVQELGSEQVRGTSTTRYRARIDLERAAREAGAVTDEESFQRFLATIDAETLRVDVWIDDDNRVRRIRMPMPLAADAGGGEVVVETEYYDFGADLDVVAPPSDDVVDLGPLLERLGAGGTDSGTETGPAPPSSASPSPAPSGN